MADAKKAFKAIIEKNFDHPDIDRFVKIRIDDLYLRIDYDGVLRTVKEMYRFDLPFDIMEREIKRAITEEIALHAQAMINRPLHEAIKELIDKERV